MPTFAPTEHPTLLARLVSEDDRTHGEIVKGFDLRARSDGENASLSVRTLRRWMSGDVTTRPRAAARRVARHYWGFSIEELLAPPLSGERPGSWPSSARDELARFEEPKALTGRTMADWTLIPSSAAVDESGTEDATAIDAAAVARRELDRTLGAGTVVEARLDQIEESAKAHRQAYVSVAPLVMLKHLLLDLADVQILAQQRQPGMVQIRLSRISGELAVLVADTLMKLGMVTEAGAWYRTARMAADDTPDLQLRVRVRAQEAMLPYYYGDPAGTVWLTREAQHLASGKHTSASALAAAAEARALARLGRQEEAISALRTAQLAFEQIDAHGDDALLDFPEKRLLLYLSGTLTYLRRTRDARNVQDRALGLYTGSFVIDPALLMLDRAICAALDKDAEEACGVAIDAVTSVPSGHRTAILRTRAEDVLRHLPPEQRRGSSAAHLREVIAGILLER